MNRYLLPLTVAFIVVGVNAGTAAELKVEPDAENVVASRLEGQWQTHNSLTERLTGNTKARPGSLSFKSDPSVVRRIPDKYVEFIAEGKLKISMAGFVKMDGRNHPFLVTNFHGNPHVVFWLERDGDEFGNGESFNVMLVVAEDKQKDLLFVGGDFNNQPFSAYERAPVAPEE